METINLNDINISTIKAYLDEITLRSSKFEEIQKNQEKILIILEKLDSKIINLDTRILKIEDKLKENNNIKIEEDFSYLKELKYETIEINEITVLKALSFRDYRSVIHIFRNYYKTKSDKKYSYPIRIVSKRTYDFYENGKWNYDSYGDHSRDTIINNIQNLFIKYNTLENNSLTEDEFMLNQDFIYKLSDLKYKKEIFKNIIEEVRLNTL